MTFVPHSNFMLQRKFRIKPFSHFPKNWLESERMVRDINEFPHFETVSSDSMHILNPGGGYLT